MVEAANHAMKHSNNQQLHSYCEQGCDTASQWPVDAVCLRFFYPAVRSADYLRPGTNDPMPGLIGKAYEEMGGTVHYVGKPHLLVYEECFKALKVAIYVCCSFCFSFFYTPPNTAGQ